MTLMKLLGTLNEIPNIVVGLEETREEDFYHVKREGQKFITIEFKRKHVQFHDNALSTLATNEFESFLAELKRQGYNSNYPNYN